MCHLHTNSFFSPPDSVKRKARIVSVRKWNGKRRLLYPGLVKWLVKEVFLLQMAVVLEKVHTGNIIGLSQVRASSA